MTGPLVSCLMVTRDRPAHVARAVRLFLAQTHRNCELVVVDDGSVDLSPVLRASVADRTIRYVRVADSRRRTLGEMRNLSLDLADGDWWIQWDDDDWYHPDRIAVQLAAARDADATGSALRWTLMHVDAPGLAHRPFRADAGFATPGTLLHRRGDLRYPALARNEDGVLLDAARRAGRIEVLGRDASYLFARCFHGANTWEQAHFLRRLHRRPVDWPSWFMSAKVRRDITTHRAFALDAVERATAEQLLSDLRDHRRRPTG